MNKTDRKLTIYCDKANIVPAGGLTYPRKAERGAFGGEVRSSIYSVKVEMEGIYRGEWDMDEAIAVTDKIKEICTKYKLNQPVGYDSSSDMIEFLNSVDKLLQQYEAWYKDTLSSYESAQYTIADLEEKLSKIRENLDF